MLSEKYEPETWAQVRFGRETIPVTHWENIIGRSGSADIRIDRERISRVHAVLKRRDDGHWVIYDIFSRGGVWVDGKRVSSEGAILDADSVINLGGSTLKFIDMSFEKREKLEKKRTSAGKSVSPGITLAELVLFQVILILQHLMSADKEYVLAITLGFAVIILLELFAYNAMRLIGRMGFEVEILAFYLTSLGMSVVASSCPDNIFKQILLVLVSFTAFIIFGWWLRGLKRTAALRIFFALVAIGLLMLNIFTSDRVNGAKSWLEFAGYSLQPSELVKVAYIYVGASTLDRLYRRRNLIVFIGFSAACVVSLALIGDFGSALVFFVTFLVISFMRSGSIATVVLAISGAGLAGFLAVSIKPYIAQRFAAWGHVWEDVYDKGYQQTRAMSAAASGGLFGKGAGAGWLTDITAADMDMVFAVISEELGLIVAICMVLAVLALAFFAVRTARHARSSYYAIAACATMTMLMVQMSLNVFGSLDLLPFTGVTFPFVSRGGTSLISCWLMMSFIKGADTRKDASFVVRQGKSIKDVSVQAEEGK